MNIEDKDLLLKDLCARLPYGVAVQFRVNEVAAIEEKFIYNVDGEYSYITNGKSYLTLDIIKALFNNHLDEIKPYLFPLSSMTEEERIAIGNEFAYGQPHKAMDILHKRHIDYRGLIPKGLAIDATGLNIY